MDDGSSSPALTEHMRSKYGDANGYARQVAVEAAAASRTAMLDGTASLVLAISPEMVLEVFHESGKKKGSVPGPDAITYEVTASVGPQTAAVFYEILDDWCSDTLATCMWKDNILTLIDKSKGVGFDALKPIGLMSMLLRTAAKCTMRTMGNDLLSTTINGVRLQEEGQRRRGCAGHRLDYREVKRAGRAPPYSAPRH